MVSTEKNSTKVSLAKDEARFNVRIPTELHERLIDRAKANDRSMNAEIIAILREAIDEFGEASIRALQKEISLTESKRQEAHQEAHVLENRIFHMQRALERMQAAAKAKR